MAAISTTNSMPEVKSCGFFVMKSDWSFLLMKHKDRYDLPKGHMEAGETEQQTALRGKLFNELPSLFSFFEFRINGRNRYQIVADRHRS